MTNKSVEDDFEAVVVEALRSFRDEIEVTRFVSGSDGGWSVDEASARYERVIWRHPEIFYVNKIRTFNWRKLPDGRLANVKITKIPYAIKPDEYPARATELEASVAAALATLDGADGDADRARRLHDFILAHCQYDRRGLTEKTPLCRTAYDALVRGRAVCEGYVMAYRLLLDRAGIESDVAVSETMNHCWNVVNVNGAWRHVDVTRDDPTYEVRLRLRERLTSHRYFLLSDRRLSAKGHHDWHLIG